MRQRLIRMCRLLNFEFYPKYILSVENLSWEPKFSLRKGTCSCLFIMKTLAPCYVQLLPTNNSFTKVIHPTIAKKYFPFLSVIRLCFWAKRSRVILLKLQECNLSVSQSLYFAVRGSWLEVVFTKHFLKCWGFYSKIFKELSSQNRTTLSLWIGKKKSILAFSVRVQF